MDRQATTSPIRVLCSLCANLGNAAFGGLQRAAHSSRPLHAVAARNWLRSIPGKTTQSLRSRRLARFSQVDNSLG